MSRDRYEFYEIAKKLKRETDVSCQMQRSHMLGPPGTLNSVTPCAACKLLRRRCAEECPFSPYFSPHEPHKFAAVHKVFGASNVSKMLMEVPERQRADAANSLVYEANLRLIDPVYGCVGAISSLQQQIQTLEAELNTARAEILKYKYKEASNTVMSGSHHAGLVAVSIAMSSPGPGIPSTPPPPSPPPPPASALAASSSSSSTSTLYTPPTRNIGYTSINSNMPYFD